MIGLIVNIPNFLSAEVKNNTCVGVTWPEKWMFQAHTLFIDTVVFGPLLLIVVLYSRVVYSLWFKRNNGQPVTHQQRVSRTCI